MSQSVQVPENIAKDKRHIFCPHQASNLNQYGNIVIIKGK